MRAQSGLRTWFLHTLHKFTYKAWQYAQMKRSMRMHCTGQGLPTKNGRFPQWHCHCREFSVPINLDTGAWVGLDTSFQLHARTQPVLPEVSHLSSHTRLIQVLPGHPLKLGTPRRPGCRTTGVPWVGGASRPRKPCQLPPQARSVTRPQLSPRLRRPLAGPRSALPGRPCSRWWRRRPPS